MVNDFTRIIYKLFTNDTNPQRPVLPQCFTCHCPWECSLIWFTPELILQYWKTCYCIIKHISLFMTFLWWEANTMWTGELLWDWWVVAFQVMSHSNHFLNNWLPNLKYWGAEFNDRYHKNPLMSYLRLRLKWYCLSFRCRIVGKVVTLINGHRWKNKQVRLQNISTKSKRYCHKKQGINWYCNWMCSCFIIKEQMKWSQLAIQTR